jgi:hypothetical protein
MAPNRSWHTTAALVCMCIALLAAYNGFKQIMSGAGIPTVQSEREGYLVALIGVPLILFAAALVLYRQGIAYQRKVLPEHDVAQRQPVGLLRRFGGFVCYVVAILILLFTALLVVGGEVGTGNVVGYAVALIMGVALAVSGYYLNRPRG